MTHITPVQALRLTEALNAMRGGRSALDIMDRTRRALGVDQLDIKQSDKNMGEASVSAGKYLGDNVFLGMEKGVGKEGGKVRVEVELTPNISVETDAGSDARGGVEFNWKWDY